MAKVAETATGARVKEAIAIKRRIPLINFAHPHLRIFFRILHRLTVNDVRVTSCPADLGKQRCAGIVVKMTGLKIEQTGFHHSMEFEVATELPSWILDFVKI